MVVLLERWVLPGEERVGTTVIRGGANPHRPSTVDAVPVRLRRAPPGEVDAALTRLDRGAASDGDTRLLVKHLLAVLTERAPGASVEVRVPPYAVAQCVSGGARHTRGTPPAVVETDAGTWIALATGRQTWSDAVADGRLRASGERSDLTDLLPLHPADHLPPDELGSPP
jgi:hypothetical protein